MRFKLSTAALAACAATALTAGAASANVTFYPFGVGAPTLPIVTNFGSDSVNSAPTHAPAGWSWSGNGTVFGAGNSHAAKPADALTTPLADYSHGFLAVEKGQTESLTIPSSAGVKDINLYVGSLDAFNSITFDLGNGTSQTYTGITLTSTGAQDGGSQVSGHSNGILNFTFNSPVDKIIFQSPTGYSLEIASIAAQIASGAPEPAEWLMLTLGVAMIGAVARRKRSFASAAAVA
jgi:hypothetical protein